jgi:hypothetical protein
MSILDLGADAVVAASPRATTKATIVRALRMEPKALLTRPHGTSRALMGALDDFRLRCEIHRAPDRGLEEVAPNHRCSLALVCSAPESKPALSPDRRRTAERRSGRPSFAVPDALFGALCDALIFISDLKHRALGLGINDQLRVDASFLGAPPPMLGIVSELALHESFKPPSPAHVRPASPRTVGFFLGKVG